jgi:Na+/proline symporter
MSIRDARQLRTSAVVGTLWNVFMAAGALAIGLVGRAVYPDASSLPLGDRENLFPYLASQQLPPVLFGLIIAAIFAAIMSTADSQLLVASSSLVRDLYQKVLRRGRACDDARLVRLSRAAVFVLVCLALLLGAVAADWIFWLVLFAWGGLGAALGPTIILSLFWRGTTRWGALAGMVVGTSTVMIWKSIPALSGMIYELVPGFAFAAFATVAVSWGTRREVNIQWQHSVYE